LTNLILNPDRETRLIPAKHSRTSAELAIDVSLFQERKTPRTHDESLMDSPVKLRGFSEYFGVVVVPKILIIRRIRVKYHFQGMLVVLKKGP
jgi:hypothetical protein